MPLDRSLLVNDVHGDLRRLLLERFYHVPVELLAAALAFEVASCVASQSKTEAIATVAIRRFADHMVGQVQHYGVGKSHSVETLISTVPTV